MFALLKKLPLGLGLCLAGVMGWPALASAASQPAFEVLLPAANRSTGGAVLIAPGGSVDEVRPLAQWLADRGLAAFILRQGAAGESKAAAVAEIARVMQDLRAHAGDFKISPKRLALLGFAEGADAAAAVAFGAEPSSRPDLVALVWGATPASPPAGAKGLPPAFLVGSTRAGDNLSGTIELWNALRAARVPVDAHFFARADLSSVLAADNPSVGSWPELFYTWARFSGLLADEPRVPVKGMVYLDGRVLPHGYVIFTPIDFAGVGPVIGRVINSTANIPIGEFTIPVEQGPIAGRYRVDVRQNMNRWLSNAFTGDLVGGRGAITPEKTYFGHHRLLAPTIDDQHSFTRVHPSDQAPYTVEFKPGAEANLSLKIEVFSQ